MRFALLPFLFLAALEARAQDCGFKVFPRGVWQGQQLPIDGGRRCFLKMSPKDGDETDYRSYNFSSDGQIMIFVGIGAPISSNTGARTYYVWPTDDVPRISKSQAGDKVSEIRSASGEVWVFDRRTQNLKEIQGCDYRYSTLNTWNENGGVEISKCRGKLVVDMGFARGKQTTQDPTHEASVADQFGNRCQIRVRDLVDFSRGTDHPRLLFSSNSQLRGILEAKPACASLDLTVLGEGLRLRAPASVDK